MYRFDELLYLLVSSLSLGIYIEATQLLVRILQGGPPATWETSPGDC